MNQCPCDVHQQWCGFCPPWVQAYLDNDATWIGADQEVLATAAVISVLSADVLPADLLEGKVR